MRKLITNAIVILVVLTSYVSYGQDEITLEFKQTMSTENAELKAMIDMMGATETKLYIKGKLVRTEIHNDVMGSTTVIYDGEKGKGITLMEMYGSKSYNLVDDSTVVEEAENTVKYTIVRNKKKVKFLGYKCINYTITDTAGTVITLYVAPSLNAENESQYSSEIKGQALYSQSLIQSDGAAITVTMEATKVTIGAIDIKLFDLSIPEGYSLSTL